MPNTNTKLVDSKTIAALFELTPRRIQQLTKEGIDNNVWSPDTYPQGWEVVEVEDGGAA